MPDAQILREYLDSGMPNGEPICLSFGESWDRIAAGLADRIHDVPRSAHGYQLSLYGLPRLRVALTEHLRTTHGLGKAGEYGRDWEVAVCWTGTRGCMFDFGRLVRERGPAGSEPVILLGGPSWDYAGVFTPLGFSMQYLPLRAEDGFEPSVEDVALAAEQIDADPSRHLAMVIINAQQNPTAVNWSPELVDRLLSTAEARQAAVLVDDAYFGVHDEHVEPTSALRQLLERRQGRPHDGTGAPWVAVRSMGKQFGCNGWGIGSAVAEPDVLDRLVNEFRLHHTLMYSGMQQHAMAGWLESEESRQFLDQQRRTLTHLRATAAGEFGTRLGYPDSAVHRGQCTPYIIVEVPPAYTRQEHAPALFRADCFAKTGVLLAPVWPWPMPSTNAEASPHLRIYLGPGEEGVTEAVRRMEAAGFVY